MCSSGPPAALERLPTSLREVLRAGSDCGQANCRYTIRSHGMGCVVAVRENGKSREARDRLAPPRGLI